MADQTVSSNNTIPQKGKYGVDAPGVIRNLGVAGVLCIFMSIYCPVIKIGSLTIEIGGLIWTGISCSLAAILMLVYSLFGKYKFADRMVALINWTGKEQVLDIGTGKGLLMITAAKKLTTGKATGIDIWNAEDLSGNNVENALNNAALEGVKDKVEILNENAMKMSFANDSFDVILSNMCLHNIYDQPGRKTACQEVGRVLKPGGTAVIADWRHVREYRKNFEEIGLQTRYIAGNFFKTFPAVSMVVVTK